MYSALDGKRPPTVTLKYTYHVKDGKNEFKKTVFASQGIWLMVPQFSAYFSVSFALKNFHAMPQSGFHSGIIKNIEGFLKRMGLCCVIIRLIPQFRLKALSPTNFCRISD
jgi:hypothetical protein